MMVAAMLAVVLARGAIPVDVDLTPAHALNRVDPLRAIGAGLDAENPGAPSAIYGAADVSAMLSSGLGPVSVRLLTELGVQDWHWNGAGTWSDAAAHDGYWTGSAVPHGTIANSWGYRLPHRGFTHDTAYDDDYSRLDDGDRSTYWKSNPYLTQAYTGESDALHPQWALVDLGTREPVDAIRLWWANPYATSYRVQYWSGYDALYAPAAGRWVDFPNGAVAAGRGGAVTLRLAPAPLRAQFVRVLMTASSHTCDTHGSSDPRDCAGYAIDELGIGTLSNGAFHDEIRHRPDNTQTATYVSSVDPWHASTERVTEDVVPGLDAVFGSGLTRGLPALVPVSLLYGTPDDAVAEIRYLFVRGDALRGVEIGEEPDGQFVVPEDYGALYVQWTKALRAIAPSLPLGGPVFQGTTSDVLTWPDARGDASWLRRFIAYVRTHGATTRWNFMSFEHYPFGGCSTTPYANLLREPALASGILHVWRADGVPSNVPFLVTEMNYSADATAVFQAVPGALWFADSVGAFLSDGASGAYLYQYAPEPLQRTNYSCGTYGSYGMFTGTPAYAVRQKTAQYFAAQLVTQQWAQPIDALQSIVPAVQPAAGPAASPVSSYAILRPDGEVAVMLVNESATSSATVLLSFHNGMRALAFSGNVTEAVFGSAQYVWHGNGPSAYASPDGPALIGAIAPASSYTLEPASITILRGRVGALSP